MGAPQEVQFRLMTYNVRGAIDADGAALERLTAVIADVAPDILAVQEAAEYQDADGVWRSALKAIAQAGACGRHVHFAPTISMREHLHVRKALFVHGIFNDWQDWQQGNAILSRWGFVRLGEPSKPGLPRSVPLYRTPLYEGSRDTDPRYALLARIDRAPLFPFLLNVHLTTLVAERGPEGGPAPTPNRAEEAQLLRLRQTRRLLDLVREHILERGALLFLMGDFNAVASEPCIASVLEAEGGFVRLAPADDLPATHLRAQTPIDHILVYPGNRLLAYRCWVVDTPAARAASDHLPVVADVTVC